MNPEYKDLEDVILAYCDTCGRNTLQIYHKPAIGREYAVCSKCSPKQFKDEAEKKIAEK